MPEKGVAEVQRIGEGRKEKERGREKLIVATIWMEQVESATMQQQNWYLFILWFAPIKKIFFRKSPAIPGFPR